MIFFTYPLQTHFILPFSEWQAKILLQRYIAA